MIVWFMNSTPKIDSAPSRNPLLWRINTCPAIHKFLDEICANVWVLLHEYAMYEAVQRQNAWQGVVDPELYCAVLKTQLRLCNTCHQSLRNEQKKGHAALSAEVKKFTRELVGGERDKLVLSQMEECHVPQRSLEHGDAPVLDPYPYPCPCPCPYPYP